MFGLSQVTDNNFEEQIINSHIPAMVDFWAEWCEPCKMVTPVIEELARNYRGKIKIVQMNVAENRDTPARFGVRSIPTLMLFKGGAVAQTIIGAYPKSRIDEELKRLL